MSLQKLPSAVGPFSIPDDVARYCRQRQITEDLDKALGIVRTAFPDLRKAELALEEHEVLHQVVRIHGEVRDTPTNVAQRLWDCIGLWVDALPRDALLLLQLDIDPETE